jgi:gluconolactonase
VERVGQYLVWSDIPNDEQLRWVPDPVGGERDSQADRGLAMGIRSIANGGRFHANIGHGAVTRYEPNGSVTVLAEKFDGKPLNAPNDAVVAPGWRDLVYGSGLWGVFEYEGKKQPLEQKEAVYSN